jgi:hypothetical protein
MSVTPLHLGVVVKMDTAFPENNQHYYLKCDVSRDGASYADCHPIIRMGAHGYYKAAMTNCTGTGAYGTAKVTLANSTTCALQGVGLYGE